MATIKQAQTPPANLKDMIPVPSAAPGIVPVTPPTNPQVSGLDALAIGPVPGVLTTTYDSIRQWIRPGVPQFRTFPLQPKAKTSTAAAATILQEIAAQNNSAVVSGLNWKGVWTSFNTYARYDVVQFNSSTYMALQSSVNVKPDTVTPSWILLSENFVYKGQWTQPGAPYSTLSLTITGVTQSGGNTIYAYSSFTGQAPALGMKVVFSGWGTPHTGNNVTAILTGVSGGLSGTVTIANGSGSTVAAGGTGVGQMFLNGTVADSISFTSGPWTAALPTTIAGNILFAFAFWDNNSTATATIVDTLGNTWHQIQHITGAIAGVRPNTTMYLWWCASKGGATSITVTPNSSSNGDLAVYEVQGPLTLDQNAAAYSAHGTPTLGPSVTTTSINEQIIAFLLLEDFPSGFTGGFAASGPVISTGVTPFISRAAAAIGTYTPGVTTATYGIGCITTSWAQQVVTNSAHIPFDVVEYLGSTYVCIAETTAVPTDTGFWVQLSQGAGGINNITGAYLAVAGDYGKLLTNTTASNYTVTLPAAPPLASWWLAFQQSGSGTIIINPNGLTIDGSGSNLTLNVNQGVLIFTDGINYFTERGMGTGGGFTNPMTTLGDILYENVTPAAARLAGNITSVKQFLSQTGTGSVSAAPGWATITEADVTNLVSDLATLTSGLALKAPLASPTLTGTPTAPTQSPLTNNTDIATTAYADAAVSVEKTRALAAEALKAPLASPAFTGTPTAPTQATGDTSGALATDAFVAAAVTAGVIGADVININGVAVSAPFSMTALVNGLGPVGEVEVNSFPLANDRPCMVENPVSLAGTQRLLATVYRNNTAFPLLVQVCVLSNTAGVVWTAVADSTANPSTVVYKTVGCNSASTNHVTLTFFVLPGQYYKVSAGSGVSTLNIWREYICQNGTLTDSGDLSGSRSLATVFQNTSGKTMFVAVQVSSVNAASAVQGVSDTSPKPTNVIDDATQTSLSANTVTIFMIVPAGHYYKVTAASGALSIWHEYSWNIPCTKSNDLAVAGQGVPRWSHAFTQSLSTGSALATAVQVQVWINNTRTVRWVQTITTASSANSFIDLITGISGDSIPGTTVASDCTQSTAAAPRHLYAPVSPNSSYSFIDTSVGSTLADVHWWEYQLG